MITKILTFGVMFAVIGVLASKEPHTPSPQVAQANPFEGCTASKREVTARLKSPSTANFAECYRKGELACLNVDSQNGFGATVRTTWLVRFAGSSITEVVQVPRMGCLQ